MLAGAFDHKVREDLTIPAAFFGKKCPNLNCIWLSSRYKAGTCYIYNYTITILLTDVHQKFSILRKSYSNVVLRVIVYQVPEISQLKNFLLLQTAIVHIHFSLLSFLEEGS